MRTVSQGSKAGANAAGREKIKLGACGVLVLGLVIAVAFPPKENEEGNAATPALTLKARPYLRGRRHRSMNR